jgi:hypothetical protein
MIGHVFAYAWQIHPPEMSIFSGVPKVSVSSVTTNAHGTCLCAAKAKRDKKIFDAIIRFYLEERRCTNDFFTVYSAEVRP